MTAIADRDAARLDAVRRLHPDVQGYADHTALLTRADVDAVVVSVPTADHYGVARDALEAGKHVLCEKPLATEVAQALDLADAAASACRVLMTGHVFLFNAGIVTLRQLLHRGDAGRLFYLRALRTNLGPVRGDVNSVFDLASHDVAIFNFLLGARPLAVSAVGGAYLQPGLEDLAFITLRYPNEVLAHVQVSWLDPKKLREIVVVGDRRMIVWDELAPIGPIHIYDKGVVREPYYDDYGQFHLLAREGDITIPRVHVEEPLKLQNAAFLECVRSGATPVSDGCFSAGVVRVLCAVIESMRHRGAEVPVCS